MVHANDILHYLLLFWLDINTCIYLLENSKKHHLVLHEKKPSDAAHDPVVKNKIKEEDGRSERWIIEKLLCMNKFF